MVYTEDIQEETTERQRGEQTKEIVFGFSKDGEIEEIKTGIAFTKLSDYFSLNVSGIESSLPYWSNDEKSLASKTGTKVTLPFGEGYYCYGLAMEDVVFYGIYDFGGTKVNKNLNRIKLYAIQIKIVSENKDEDFLSLIQAINLDYGEGMENADGTYEWYGNNNTGLRIKKNSGKTADGKSTITVFICKTDMDEILHLANTN